CATLLAVCIAAVSEVPAPTNLTLTSRNLQHLLTWRPGPGTPPGSVYRVTKRTDRDVEAAVHGCERVQPPLTCNLTAALQKHPFDSYSIRVTALVGNQASPAAEFVKFKPVEHLDPPLVTVTPCGRNLCVELRPPHSSLSSVYNQSLFQLQIRDSSSLTERILKVRVSMEGEVLEHLSSGRQYCVSIRFAPTPDRNHSNFSQPVCAHTPSIFAAAEPLIAVLLCLLLTAVTVCMGLFLWTRTTCLLFSKLPSVLVSGTTIRHLEEVLVQSLPESVSSLSNTGGPKALALSSSEDSEDEEEESITDSSGASSQEGYKGRGDSSSLPSSSGLRPPPTSCPDPPCQKKAQDPRSRTELSGSTAEVGTDEQKLLGGEAGAQEVNLLTVTFSRELEEQQEDHLLSLCCSGPSEEGAGPEEDLAGGVTAASQPPQREVVEEKEDDSSGYMCRSQHSVEPLEDPL
uniref:Fibronectin type-III domain-containing protein n=1 Tax=Oryzias latipes TaxID=8090 RepID=A0A3P9H4S1_ORYLA